MFSSLAVLALAAVPAYANVFTTAPVSSTSWAAGQAVSVTWQDDGSSPSLQSFGPASISLCVGSVSQQTVLQDIADNVDVSKQSSAQFTPQASAGPNGNFYFIKFMSNSLKDANSSQFPAEAFSAKFTLTGMTGNFNATISSEINGQSVGPGSSSAAASSSHAAASSPAASPAAAPVTTASHSSSSSGSSSTASPSAASKAKNGAARAVGTGIFGVVGVAVVASSLFL